MQQLPSLNENYRLPFLTSEKRHKRLHQTTNEKCTSGKRSLIVTRRKIEETNKKEAPTTQNGERQRDNRP